MTNNKYRQLEFDCYSKNDDIKKIKELEQELKICKSKRQELEEKLKICIEKNKNNKKIRFFKYMDKNIILSEILSLATYRIRVRVRND